MKYKLLFIVSLCCHNILVMRDNGRIDERIVVGKDTLEERISLRSYQRQPVDKDPVWPDNIENIVLGNMSFPQGVPEGMPCDSVVVKCRFEIDDSGYVDNAYVYGKHNLAFKNTALSIVYALPRIIPAQRKGKSVPFEYELVIPFIRESIWDI